MTLTNDAPTQTLNPEHILQIGMGFCASKPLLSAVELELFTHLADGARTGDEIAAALDLHPRSRYDFLDALVALGLSARDGDGPDARYRNTPETVVFLEKGSPAYVGGILEMANAACTGSGDRSPRRCTRGSPRTRSSPARPDCSRASMPTPSGCRCSSTACRACSSVPSRPCAPRSTSAPTAASATSAAPTGRWRRW